MIKQTIAFDDLDGNEITEIYRFNISPSELIDIEVDYPEGFGEHFKKVMAGNNRKDFVEVFKRLIRESYGQPHPDGRRFSKSPEIYQAFRETDAYEKLFMLLLTDEPAAAKFFNDILPHTLFEAARQLMEEREADGKKAEDGKSKEKTTADYTDEQLIVMSQEKFDKVAGIDAKKWDTRTLQIAFKRKG